MIWFICIITSTAVIGLSIGSVLLALGRRFLKEFTRPGVTIQEGTPEWGGWTFPEAVGEPPLALQRAVTFFSADGTLLRGAFWAQAHQAPTIIISHGFHFPSQYFRSVAALEYAHGANVLLFDYRGHGESSQIATTCGNAEINDLLAAIDVAVSQVETTCGQIYIHGFSMGAAVALLLPPNASIAGIIADSSYARLDDMIRMQLLLILDQETAAWHNPKRAIRLLIPSLSHLIMLSGRLLFRMLYHHSLVARPDLAITRQKSKQKLENIPPPILLIHAEDDPLIALHHAHRLVAIAHAAGRTIHTYYTPSSIHCGSYGYDPQHYMTLLLEFMVL